MSEIIVFAALFALQIGDFWSTLRAIESGKGKEANPWIASLMERIGVVPALLLVKGAGVGISFYLAFHAHVLFGVVMIAVYVYVLANNLSVLSRDQD